MPGFRIETPATVDPVSLQVVKQHLRVNIDNDDELIGIYLRAATRKVEGFLGRSLINKLYLQTLDRFPHAHHDGMHAGFYTSAGFSGRHGQHGRPHPLQIKLLRSPLVSATKIEYYDTNGVLQTLRPKVTADLWEANTAYDIGEMILDSNGNVQTVTDITEVDTPGSNLSGAAAPTWSTVLNTTTVDNGLTWTAFQVPAYAGDFQVDTHSEPGRILPNVNQPWPYTLFDVPNSVRTFFTAGYGTDGLNIPDHFKTAILIYTAGLYEFREPVSELPLKEIPSHLRDLLWEDRIKDFAPTEG
jgi:hypothetical protein